MPSSSAAVQAQTHLAGPKLACDCCQHRRNFAFSRRASLCQARPKQVNEVSVVMLTLRPKSLGNSCAEEQGARLPGVQHEKVQVQGGIDFGTV